MIRFTCWDFPDVDGTQRNASRVLALWTANGRKPVKPADFAAAAGVENRRVCDVLRGATRAGLVERLDSGDWVPVLDGEN